jgi:hypothetical protein
MPLPRPLHAGLALLALAVLPIAARATTLAPDWSYTKTSPNGQYVFVMLGYGGWKNWREEPERVAELRRRYPQSGLYRNDDSAELLWTVDWYGRAVYVANDGIHLARVHAPQRRTAEGEAVSFYANGQPLRTHRVEDLVDYPGRLPEVGEGPYRWVKRDSFDEAGLKLTVETEDGNTFVFDARTGEIVQESRPGRLRRLVLRGAGVVGLVAVAYCVRLLLTPRKPRPTYAVNTSAQQNPAETDDQPNWLPPLWFKVAVWLYVIVVLVCAGRLILLR